MVRFTLSVGAGRGQLENPGLVHAVARMVRSCDVRKVYLVTDPSGFTLYADPLGANAMFVRCEIPQPSSDFYVVEYNGLRRLGSVSDLTYSFPVPEQSVRSTIVLPAGLPLVFVDGKPALQLPDDEQISWEYLDYLASRTNGSLVVPADSAVKFGGLFHVVQFHNRYRFTVATQLGMQKLCHHKAKQDFIHRSYYRVSSSAVGLMVVRESDVSGAVHAGRYQLYRDVVGQNDETVGVDVISSNWFGNPDYEYYLLPFTIHKRITRSGEDELVVHYKLAVVYDRVNDRRLYVDVELPTCHGTVPLILHRLVQQFI